MYAYFTSSTDSVSYSSMPGSPQNGKDEVTFLPTSKSETKEFVKASLFDEGLRIAKQYGMSDFAMELTGMSQVSNDEDEIDEQEEWNREVEKDMVSQEYTKVNGTSTVEPDPAVVNGS